VSLGKQVRLNRIFAHESGRLSSVAVDHFIMYTKGQLPPGLKTMRRTLELVVAGKPDAVTMHRGVASHFWGRHAGEVPFILQSSLIQIDDSVREQIADPEDAVRLGADAFAVAAFVRGATEGLYLRTVADAVKMAERLEMPVITHIYPRRLYKELSVSFEPEDIAWAVHCAYECGTDVVKVPYCNDVSAYSQIISECPVPVVAAGGPKTSSFEEALTMLKGVVESGARGATVGRNVWGVEKVTEAVRALKLVIHDRKSPREAMVEAGIA